MNKFLLLPVLALSISAAKAQNPVWSTDVAPILFNKCASCHRPTGIAPFSLLTYGDAQANAGSISAAVQSKNMPPWPPDPAYSALAHERLLSQNEINKIKDWALNGAQQGDPNLAPPQPQFSANGDLPGTPDLAIQIPTYTSTASGGDVYQCFVIPSNQASEKFITAFEAIPGNREIVHHVLVYADTTGACANLDAQTPGPGYTSFGGVGTNDAKLIGGWVPGTAPIQMPNGFGIRLPKNADIVVQIHYPAGSNGQTDDTKVNFFFSPSAVRSVNIDPVLNHATNITPALFIPANQVKTFSEQQLVPFNASVLGVAPHMHLIGRKIDVFGVSLASTDTQKYIRINEWDFHWQGFYMFKKIKKISAGTTLYSTAFYDNTSGNPFNPSNPPQDVAAGEATTDEMMLTYFIWTQYQPGDENIIIDSTFGVNVPSVNLYNEQELFVPYPNPATNELVIKYYVTNTGQGSIDITDMAGKVVKQIVPDMVISSGYHTGQYSVADLANGMYILRLHSPGKTLTQKLVISR